MPRFVLEHVVVTPAQRERLEKLGAERFPEIDVEHRQPDGARAERWVCRSTSAAQLDEWLTDGGVRDFRIVGTAGATDSSEAVS